MNEASFCMLCLSSLPVYVVNTVTTSVCVAVLSFLTSAPFFSNSSFKQLVFACSQFPQGCSLVLSPFFPTLKPQKQITTNLTTPQTVDQQ